MGNIFGSSRAHHIEQFLCEFENASTFNKNKHFGTAFEDIINYIISSRCCEGFNKIVPKSAIYTQLASNHKGIDGLIKYRKSEIGVQIKFSKNIDIPFSCDKKQLNPCLEYCLSSKINKILIVTNRSKIRPTVKQFFESQNIKYSQLTREDFSNIDRYHIKKMENLKSVKDLVEQKSYISCSLL